MYATDRKSSPRRFAGDTRGQVLLESLLIAPVLVLLMTWIGDQGWMYVNAAEKVADFRLQVGQIYSEARGTLDPAARLTAASSRITLLERSRTRRIDELARGIPVAYPHPLHRALAPVEDAVENGLRGAAPGWAMKPLERFELRELRKIQRIPRYFDNPGTLALGAVVVTDEGQGRTRTPGYFDYAKKLFFWGVIDMLGFSNLIQNIADLEFP